MSAADYQLSDTEATVLQDVAGESICGRREILAIYAADNGIDALINLFAQFVGLANAVVTSSREATEMILITEGSMHPHAAERANLPTIGGALSGAILANSVDPAGLCTGCAYRKGTPANHSPSTTSDAEYELQNGGDFHCHMNEPGEATKKCIGHAKAAHALRKHSGVAAALDDMVAR